MFGSVDEDWSFSLTMIYYNIHCTSVLSVSVLFFFFEYILYFWKIYFASYLLGNIKIFHVTLLKPVCESELMAETTIWTLDFPLCPILLVSVDSSPSFTERQGYQSPLDSFILANFFIEGTGSRLSNQQTSSAWSPPHRFQVLSLSLLLHRNNRSS